jgi:hypothetical protein
MTDFKKIVKDRTVEIYDANENVGEAMLKEGAGRVTVFDRSVTDSGVASGVSVRPYRSLLEAVDCITTVCVLNDQAIKIMVAMYPSAPKYVLLPLKLHPAWIFGLIGLLRRLILGLVRIEGVAKLPGKGTRHWLVIEQSGGAVHSIPVLPKSIGVQAFLDWLKEENVRYVVLRFFEKLPELHREAGDLDFLVSDEDKKKVLKFLKDNEHLAKDDAGDIRIGFHSVSGEKGTIPYYSPSLARAMIQNAVDGPAGSRIPNPKDALNSFIYHVLYHSKKGYSSGIPSTLDDFVDKHPENDYAGMIKQLAKKAGVEVGETMEDLDEYMASVGWRPKLDTLSKMSWTNAWIKDRFFAIEKKDQIKGLAVFILRQWVVDRGLTEEVEKHIVQKGYKILRSKLLSDEEKQIAFQELRGGTWGGDADGNTEGWRPAQALVVIDTQCARMPVAYSEGFEHFRIRQLKEELRSRFDEERSSMHSTDNTEESWEYIAVCFKDEVVNIRKEALEYSSESPFGFMHTLTPKYLKHSIKQTLRRFFITHFLE